MVSKLRRCQIRLYRTEGEVLTSTRLVVGGIENEFFTISTIAFVFGVAVEKLDEELRAKGVVILPRYGTRWVNAIDVMPLFGLTTSR